MRHFTLIILMGSVVLALGAEVARAEGIWFSYHEFSGSGWADVFDGGLPDGESDGGMGSGGPEAPNFGFFTSDITQPGSMGASAGASGGSRIVPWEGGGMRVTVDLSVRYLGSLFTGGDNPGGAAEGDLFSIVEFVMPADDLQWFYQLQIRDSIEFDGSTNVVFENVTQGEVLLELTSEVLLAVETTLSGKTGDLIRITSMMSGSGETSGGSIRIYNPILDTLFIVPEPGTVSLLLVATLLATRGRKYKNRNARDNE